MLSVRKKDYNNLEDYEKLLLIFNEEDDEVLNMLSEGDEIMKEYIKDSKNASEEEEIIGLYDKELNDDMLKRMEIKENREEAFNEGIQEGIQEGICETAKNMLQRNLSFDLISECTGLSLDKLKELKKEVE